MQKDRIKNSIALMVTMSFMPMLQVRPMQEWPLLAAIGVGLCGGVAMAGQSLYQWLSPSNETLINRANTDFAKRLTYQASLQKVRDAYNISDQWLINNSWINHTLNEKLLYDLAASLWQKWIFQQTYRDDLQSYVATLCGHVNTLNKRIESLEQSLMLSAQETHELGVMRTLVTDVAGWQKELHALGMYFHQYKDFFELAEKSWLLDYNYKKEVEALNAYSYDQVSLLQEVKTIARSKYTKEYYVALAYTKQLDSDIMALNYLFAHTVRRYQNIDQFVTQLVSQLRALRSVVDVWYEAELLSYERRSIAR